VAVKSIKKRQAILEAAYRLFSARGFEGTSMSAIVAVVGGSKGTIYAHFGSKEKLFVDCMFSVPEHSMDRVLGVLQAGATPLDVQLRDFGEAFLRLACTPEVVSVRRLMISEAQRSGMGRMFLERFQAFQQEVESFLSTCMAQDRLRRADARLAATQLRLLLEAEVIDPLLLCATDGPIADGEIRRMSGCAIETFLRAYAPAVSPVRADDRPAGVRAARAEAACPLANAAAAARSNTGPAT
jgi:TetR/AcrR family transcriptional repressor of mexJK operon